MPIPSVGQMGDRAAVAVREFLRLQSASGILLMGAAALALILANTRAGGLYEALLGTPVEIRIGALKLAKPLVLWINDGLMAVFFFLVGLEIKREVVEGELSNPAQIVLPALAAAGGMLTPAALYCGSTAATPSAAAAGPSRRPPTSRSPWASSRCSARASRGA
jgi:NhaA family Na+:H+ antiporter